MMPLLIHVEYTSRERHLSLAKYRQTIDIMNIDDVYRANMTPFINRKYTAYTYYISIPVVFPPFCGASSAKRLLLPAALRAAQAAGI